MTDSVITYDNTWDKSHILTDQQLEDLSLIDGRTVGSLCARDEHGVSLLVFPDSLGQHGDAIEEQPVLEIRDKTISTGNLMGFIGCRNTRVRIRSRFDRDNDNDYFLHYVLSRVFSINIFDLQHSTDRESVFDFVLFFFPFFLNRALSQGLYKEYVTLHHNDSKVRGVIDVSRHIRMNTPFMGNVAYNTREHTADNDLIELIRHTIEHIRAREFGSSILSRDEETRENVSLIIDATPCYEKRDRVRIINRNLRSKNHPYYSEYEPLRNLCLQILRQEELKYGKDDDTVYGVLFDGAWLWESYLWTLLPSRDFIHPDNIQRTHSISLFKSGGGTRFPDFYSKSGKLVLDAKYKRYENKSISGISREDLAQVISYMYIKCFRAGVFLVPGGDTANHQQKELNGYGGLMHLLNLPIPIGMNTYDSFSNIMAEHERTFIHAIETINAQE